jgi:hypothetical protein
MSSNDPERGSTQFSSQGMTLLTYLTVGRAIMLGLALAAQLQLEASFATRLTTLVFFTTHKLVDCPIGRLSIVFRDELCR